MIKDLPNIEKVEASEDFALHIKFRRGGWKTVRLAGFIARETSMLPLREEAVFRRAKVSDWEAELYGLAGSIWELQPSGA